MRADSCRRTVSRAGAGGRVGSGGGASTTAALVPPSPIELTSTYRSSSGQVSGSVGTRNGLSASSPSSRGRSKSGCGGTRPVRTTCTALISPAIPAADSACPMLTFTEPSPQKPVRSVVARSPSVRPASSTWSPSGVPEPCAST